MARDLRVSDGLLVEHEFVLEIRGKDSRIVAILDIRYPNTKTGSSINNGDASFYLQAVPSDSAADMRAANFSKRG